MREKLSQWHMICTTVVTVHKPLLNILNDRSLADIRNRRLQNLKEKTLVLPGEPHETMLGSVLTKTVDTLGVKSE